MCLWFNGRSHNGENVYGTNGDDVVVFKITTDHQIQASPNTCARFVDNPQQTVGIEYYIKWSEHYRDYQWILLEKI